MKKKFSWKTLIQLVVLLICMGDLMYTGGMLLYGTLAGKTIGLTYFGIIIATLELIMSEVCYDELKARARRISL